MQRGGIVLQNIKLFEDIEEENLKAMLGCIGALKKNYEKGQTIIRVEDEISSIGVVVTGSVQVIKVDFDGNKVIVMKLYGGELFSVAVVCAGVGKSPVSVVASEKSKILFIPLQKIITTCPSSCSFHTRLIQNMVKLIAQNNISLNDKLELLSQKTTREKLIAYLKGEMKKIGEKSFEIPFSREELADFLCVDRSAMSRELGKMRDEGLIDFKKNRFGLLS